MTRTEGEIMARSATEVVPDASPSQVQVVSFDAPGLGDRSYLVHDGAVALVVDPQREQERYLEEAAALGVSITHVLETHVHNDYVSGGLALARHTGATYVLPQGVDLAFADECLTLGDGAELNVGSLRVSALWTPGHTANHLSYLVRGAGGEGVVCTGGSVLRGSVGRTDLLGDERADELAAAQWRSARRLLGDLDAATRVLPTHGFGSFCSATPAAGTKAGDLTVADEAMWNPALQSELEDFVASLRRDRPPIPAYYRFMAPINRSGPARPRYQPLTAFSGDDLDRWLDGGGVVTDLRARRAFAAGHRRGALNIELGDHLTTYFGWVVPFDAPYALIADTVEELETSRRLLARIGREHVEGYVLAGDIEPRRRHRYRVATFRDLAETVRHGESPVVVDIRHDAEWSAGHLAVARHIPLPDLARHRRSLPSDQAIWVHCAAGFRAAIAASQLSAWGLGPVLVDDLFEHAALHDLAVQAGSER